ncbi:MAG: isocitrate lyase/phosphoenolpyruvate mutase family protein [Acidobacteria bacterium]|nr:isocitrate lyase/phosphoenolpyruvate mutase family protein [Acidobacteriota bacterium]
MVSSKFKARRALFRRLPEAGCFAIPDPWDTGTARYLRHLGFQALATTSAGFAFSRGLPTRGLPGTDRQAADGPLPPSSSRASAYKIMLSDTFPPRAAGYYPGLCVPWVLEKLTCGPTGLRPISFANSSRSTRIFPPTATISG